MKHLVFVRNKEGGTGMVRFSSGKSDLAKILYHLSVDALRKRFSLINDASLAVLPSMMDFEAPFF